MPKFEQETEYLDVDVYEAAKQRIHHILDIFDSYVVCFSGGKDSLAVIHLTKEVFDERGITDPINVIFRDEELIPDDVIAFVDEYYHKDWINMKYYACQLKSNKYILGQTFEYIQWDKNREWIREKPEYAITLDDDTVYEQYSMDTIIANDYKGKVALVNGIRAQESVVRYKSCVNKRNENYICASDSPKAMMCKPIYDWSEDDIFKYFYDKEITYCKIYDVQMLNGEALRVATPLHAESAKRFDKIKTRYPQFYQQLVDLFPEMLIQERYYKDYDQYALMDKYPQTYEGIQQYIMENITDKKMRSLALTRLRQIKNLIGKSDGYTIRGVFKQIMTGAYKRQLLPQKSSKL